jgi:NADH dehydrogenase [ubiquinone] 1 alpha subcomplex assembly factor 6
MNREEWVSVCGDMVHRLDRDRFMCTALAPVEKRPPLLALLAFNLEIATIPELVSEALLGEIRLQWWRDAIDAIFSSQQIEHPVALGLAAAIGKYGLTRSLFDDYLDARSFDMQQKAPASLIELENYAGSSAGALNELMGEVLQPEMQFETRAAVRDVGIAWALSGLLFSVPFHAGQGRSYLPDDVEEGEQIAAVAQSARIYIKKAREASRFAPAVLLPVMSPVILAGHRLGRLSRYQYDPYAPQLQRPPLSRLAHFYWKVMRKRY